jgi:hypothetical protein
MALANCLRVVFLQSDPGQYMVGNIIWNLTRPLETLEKAIAFTREEGRPSPTKKYGAPEPVDAEAFAFKYKRQLDESYLHYAQTVANDPSKYFFKGKDGKPDVSKGITSFLCTDPAMDIFNAAAAELEHLELRHPEHRPVRSDGLTEGVLSNVEALSHVRAFLLHAVREARRGTPHR